MGRYHVTWQEVVCLSAVVEAPSEAEAERRIREGDHWVDGGESVEEERWIYSEPTAEPADR